MQLALKNSFTRRLLILLEVVLFLAASAWIAKTYIATSLSRNPDVKHLQSAVRLDPANAAYQLALGRLYQYGITDLQPGKALQYFRRSAELSPRDPKAWLELAAALELQGQTSDAEKYLRQVDSLAPNLPSFQWAIGNFFLLHGNTRESLRHLKVVLAGTRQYDRILFDTAWKAVGDPNVILEELIPHELPAEFAYLYYLVSRQKVDETKPVWKRISSGPNAFPAQGAGPYMDYLLNLRHPGDAFHVWTDLQARGLIRSFSQGTDENLLTNGNFEDGLVNLGFDWRIIPLEVVYVGLDTSTFHSAGHSLLVQFSGKQNLDYTHVFQYLKVDPDRSFRLEGFMKTENITTDSGPRLQVFDLYDPSSLNKYTESLTGSTDGWVPLTLDFKTAPKTELIVIRLTRFPSRKFDNLIAGKVWLDDVRLTPLPRIRKP